MKQISLRLDDGLAALIEAARGDVPRERWIKGVLRAQVAPGMWTTGAVFSGVAEPALSAETFQATGGAIPPSSGGDTPRPSPAGRKAKSDATIEPARPAVASPRGASRPPAKPGKPASPTKYELDMARQRRLNEARYRR